MRAGDNALMAIQHPIGTNVRRIREQKGWSQEKLAEMAELDRTYISGIERGLRNPTIIVVQRIADALGVNAWDLLEKAERGMTG